MDLVGRQAAVAQVGVVTGGRSIREEDDLEVAEERVTGGGVTAVLGGDPRDHHGGHPEPAQNDLQIGAIEGAEAVLADHDLIVARRDLWKDRGTGGAGYQRIASGDRRGMPEEP